MYQTLKLSPNTQYLSEEKNITKNEELYRKILVYIIKNWIGTFYKHAQWLQCSGLPRLCFLKRFAKIKQSAYLTQTFPLILWLRTPSKLLITAPGRQFGTENLVNTLINWIRFHVEQTKSGEFVILGFLIITSSHFFIYWPLIIEIKKKVFFSIYWQGFDVKFQVSATEKLRFL